MEQDERLKKRFIDGICYGLIVTSAMAFATVILFFLMFEF